ncbi:class I SAM-dependent methyltransferase [Nonlabens xiamenensis]|uniref:class I SAM-dependent methyltransferase n=1 Tax=Nonlabens xiamenensis TaxID=2341043 RepID=UPI000F607323|nr:class I SAM-dependent methyltransferase [Nonlabens xiamenensis]
MALLTLDDIIDVYGKLRQRGLGFILSKFNFKGLDRTRSAFDNSAARSSNAWNIPQVNQRWNQMITGDPHKEYEAYLVEKYLSGKKGLKMISFGSGNCAHELLLATTGVFDQITCVDIVQDRLDEAKSQIDDRHLAQMNFLCENIYDLDLPEKSFDMVFFHASLHHFKDIPALLDSIVGRILRADGLLVINEYVGPNRLQFPSHQKNWINKGLRLIPKKFRKRKSSGVTKNKFYGSGTLRMIMADPSECVDSSSIIPALHDQYETLEERPFGGNLVINILKDIAHHFTEENPETIPLLQDLFALEDLYLETYPSDYVFGVYRKSASNSKHLDLVSQGR